MHFYSWQRRLHKALDVVANILATMCRAIYNIIEKVWPSIRDKIVSICQHPLLVGFFTNVIEPLYINTVPYIIPVASVYVSCLCSRATIALCNDHSFSYPFMSKVRPVIENPI